MMKTFRFWLENDPEIPPIQRLHYAETEVPIADVLQQGIHPWQREVKDFLLGKRVVQILNQAELKFPELNEFGYCRDLDDAIISYYPRDSTPFEDLLQNIQQKVGFVESLTYSELLQLAKNHLRSTWSHARAKELLSKFFPGFDGIRTFLKSKDKGIKLSGYADLDQYDLSRMLTVEDFQSQESLLISHGLPCTNFRSAQFLEQITDSRRFLKLTDRIRRFQIHLNKDNWYDRNEVLYNVKCEGDTLRLVPELNREVEQRERAQQFAARWRLDSGRYCFTTGIPQLSQMLETKNLSLNFPYLGYMEPRIPPPAAGQIADVGIPIYVVSPYVTLDSTGEDLRKVLREYGVSMTGRKTNLLEKLASLAVKIYQQKQAKLDEYFRTHRFIHISIYNDKQAKPFAQLQEVYFGSFILAMYIVRHLRSNTVLDARYENETYELIDLARALLKEEISLDGAFLRVE